MQPAWSPSVRCAIKRAGRDQDSCLGVRPYQRPLAPPPLLRPPPKLLPELDEELLGGGSTGSTRRSVRTWLQFWQVSVTSARPVE